MMPQSGQNLQTVYHINSYSIDNGVIKYVIYHSVHGTHMHRHAHEKPCSNVTIIYTGRPAAIHRSFWNIQLPCYLKEAMPRFCALGHVNQKPFCRIHRSFCLCTRPTQHGNCMNQENHRSCQYTWLVVPEYIRKGL